MLDHLCVEIPDCEQELLSGGVEPRRLVVLRRVLERLPIATPDYLSQFLAAQFE